MPTKQDITKILKVFTPAERGFAEAVATDRIENQLYERQLTELKASYDNLYRIFISLLAALPEKELTFHSTQLLRFKEEYRIDQQFDEESGLITLKLKTLAGD